MQDSRKNYDSFLQDFQTLFSKRKNSRTKISKKQIFNSLSGQKNREFNRAKKKDAWILTQTIICL